MLALCPAKLSLKWRGLGFLLNLTALLWPVLPSQENHVPSCPVTLFLMPGTAWMELRSEKWKQ